MSLTLRQIEVFLDLAESLHFSRTAVNLGIPQPAVSRSVRALEKALGVDLFRRHTRSVQLTQAGQVFKTAAGDTREHLERAVERARSAAAGRVGQLRIAFMEFAVEGGFPGRLKAFKNACPQVSVDTRSSYTDKIIEDIGRGSVDIGFVVGPLQRDGIATRTIHSHRYVAVLPPHHRLAGRRSLELAELKAEPFVLGRRATWEPYLDRIEALCQRAGFSPDVVQEADWSESIFAFVRAGIGVTIYVERSPALNPAGIVVRPLDDIQDTVATQMIWREDNDDPVLKKFLET